MFRTEHVDGAPVRVANADAAHETPHAVLEQAVREAAEEHFRLEIQHPELYSRLGDSIDVFDYIDPATPAEILTGMLDNGASQASQASQASREHGVPVDISWGARAELLAEWAARPELGGRGIGSVVETAVINSLARAIFEHHPAIGAVLTLDQLTRSAGTWSVTWSTT